MSKPTPLPTGQYTIFVAILALHSIIGGYWAGTRPNGAGWRFFSWHPLLMMLGEYHDYFVMMVAQLNLERGVGASYADFFV